jgi:hypothetical protein
MYRIARQESVAKNAERRRGVVAYRPTADRSEALLDCNLPADLHARLQSH